MAGCTAPAGPKAMVPDSSTVAMGRLFERIATETEANPIRNVHANKDRVEKLLQVEMPARIQDQVSYLSMLGQETTPCRL